MSGSPDTFDGYQNLHRLGSTAAADLYRAHRARDERTVLLKVALPGPDRLGWEHETLRALDLPGVARPLDYLAPALELAPAALVLADAPGQLLSTWLDERLLPLSACVRLALRLSATLEALHGARLVHLDVRPLNVVASEDGLSAVLVDFSRAVLAEGETSPPSGEVDWAYVSPEQTGRVDRTVDHRSDLYSLGVTLFRMLTGQLPFRAAHPLEWCHCHIARMAPGADEVSPRVPPILAALVARLLAKDPDERYQTARGLRHDLERCRESLDRGETIEPFALGSRDAADRLRLPSRLFGRRLELGRLKEAYDRVASSGGVAVCLISGEEGAGKTALVQQLRAPVMAGDGTFASARFDRLDDHRPHAFLASAFGGLLRQLGSGGDGESWHRRLREELAGDARGLVAAIPALEPILGQPASAETDADAALRFRRLVRQFVGLFTQPGRPLVLFLDDLQWADRASLAVIADLVTHPDTRSLMLVGAYRSAGLESASPLATTIEGLRGLALDIRLGPLASAELTALVAATLACEASAAAPLATLIGQRTGGNPFLARQLLMALEREGLLCAQKGGWRWNLETIRSAAVTEKAELVTVDQIARLPPATRDLLEWAACLGRQFGLGTLARLCGREQTQVAEELRPVVAEGLVLTSVGDLVGEQNLAAASHGYHWLHDRVRQASYALIAPDDLPRRHLAIARLISPRADRPDDDLFAALSHYARAATLIDDAEERARVAELNLAAGWRARATFAYASALHYFDAALRLLPADLWAARPELAGPLCLARAECHLHGGDPRQTVLLAGLVAARVSGVVEKVAALALVQDAHIVRDETAEAMAVTLAGLNLIGVNFPPSPAWAAVEDERARVDRLLIDHPGPPAWSPEVEAVMRLAPCGDLDAPNLYCLHVARMVAISLERGPFEGSALWYGAYAGVLAGFFEDYDGARLFGRLAWELTSRRGSPEHEVQVLHQLSAVSFWTHSLDQSLAEARENFRRANDVGNTLFANHGALAIAHALLARSEPLQRCGEELDALIAQARYPVVKGQLVIARQLVQALRGTTRSLDRLGDERFDDHDFERRLAGPTAARPAPSEAFAYWTARMQLCFIAEDFGAARVAGDRARRLVSSQLARSPYRDFCLFHALTLARRPTAADEEELSVLAARIGRWAETNPDTFAANHALVAAELARLNDRPWEAVRLYDESVRQARRAGLLREEALGCQLAAAFYREHDQGDVADLYLRKARSCYARWGADGKVKALNQGLLRTGEHPVWAGPDQPPAVAAPAQSVADRLDLMAVVRASQALSGEIVLPRLLQILMRTVLEAAGAQQGWLLLGVGTDLRVGAAAAVNGAAVEVEVRPDSISTESPLPWSVINYVQRTGERVMLLEGQERNPFARDPYLLRRRPRSLLCLPIVRRAECVGILYLESRVVASTFTPERLVALEVMAAQAAISLDNARLFASAERENAERRRAEDRFAQAFHGSPAAMAILRLRDQVLLDINQSHLAVLGLTREQAVGRPVDQLGLMELAQVNEVRRLLREHGRVHDLELGARTASGETRILLTSLERLDLGGEECALSAALDITERKRAEEQLRQSQKMEAIGHLAGGVAHDFNNLLTAINGYSNLALRDMDANHPLFVPLREILRAGERAAGLTRQLLAHSRKQVLAPRVWDLNVIVGDLVGLLRRLIGEDIDLQVVQAPGPALANIDRGQMEQIVLNLAINARDAMPRGGHLRMETGTVMVEDPAAQPELRPGPHVVLTVSDDGVGMNGVVKARLFEPFFTTKEPGQGTGLGLSTVYGIVKQSGGGINVDSTPGAGSTFRIYFPRSVSEAGAPEAVAVVEGPSAPHDDVTILLVEDDDLVRSFAVQALESYGYHILQARDGREAFAVLDRGGHGVNMVITDVVMPDMGGRELAERMRDRFPAMPVLYFSGYGEPMRNDPFLHKPFGPSELAWKVKQVLEGA
jgi:PAS domain S-box-containing protein